MNLPNIFWILTDGTRYKPGQDKFGRLPIYCEFDKESIHFEKAITTAASTIMSITAILTGRFAAELYPHFKYVMNLDFTYPNYIAEFKKKGYIVNASILNNGAGRKKFKDLMGSCIDQFPRDTVTSGDDSFIEFRYLMEHKFDKNKPNLIFVHLGWFMDNNQAVINIMNYLKKKDVYENSIIICSSDHGYVDYGRFHHLGWALQPRTHSLYVDENTYRANLNIKLPKSITMVESKNITVPVCLIDLFETLSDYLGIIYTCDNKKAKSLRPLIETNDPNVEEQFKKRILRVDTRYAMQDYHKTRLINDYYSYILSSEKDAATLPKPFKDYYAQLCQELKKTNFKILNEQFNKSELANIKNKKIIIYYYNHKDFINYVYTKLSTANTVSILDLKSIKRDYNKYDIVFAFVDNPYFYMYSRLYKFCKRKDINLYLFDNFFTKIAYKKYNYILEVFNDYGLKEDHHWILKCGLFIILIYIRIYETLILKYIGNNYHPLIKTI